MPSESELSPPDPRRFESAPSPALAPGREFDEYVPPLVPERPPQRKVLLPAVLFVATCLNLTYLHGLAYCVPLMVTLLAHELGHFLQAVRYRIPASYPFFIPFFPPFGTMGAVIVTRPGRGNRVELFDIAITGPLIGLLPALAFCVLGLHWSETRAVLPSEHFVHLGERLVFQWLAGAILGTPPEGHEILLHPVAFAGWVGIFVTALNLIPIGQLDGGHILYTILGRRAHGFAKALLAAAAIAVIYYGYWGWTLMLFLLTMMGAAHPPTADDEIPLGLPRTVLGWAMLCFVPLGFTPTPIIF